MMNFLDISVVSMALLVLGLNWLGKPNNPLLTDLRKTLRAEARSIFQEPVHASKHVIHASVSVPNGLVPPPPAMEVVQ